MTKLNRTLICWLGAATTAACVWAGSISPPLAAAKRVAELPTRDDVVLTGLPVRDADTDAVTRTTPANSSPIAVTSDDRLVWVANPDDNSVGVIDVAHVRLLGRLRVGRDPQCVAIAPNDRKVFVTNAASNSVSVIDARLGRVVRTIRVGAEPFGCAVTADGRKLFVANFASNSVSVIDIRRSRVAATIRNVSKARGIAIAGGPGASERVYVTHFLAELRNDSRSVEQKEGADDGKDGRVTVLSAQTNRVLATAVLNPLADTGFRSNGTTLGRIPVRTDEGGAPIFDHVTGAFPNLMQSIVVKGSRAYPGDLNRGVSLQVREGDLSFSYGVLQFFGGSLQIREPWLGS